MVNANGCRLNERIGLQRMRTYNDTAWKIQIHILLQQYPL